MSTLSVTPEPGKARRRRHTHEFKAHIVEACRQPDTSVSRVALDHGLNANMVRRWIREFEQTALPEEDTPGFMSLALTPSAAPVTPKAMGRDRESSVRIELPSQHGTVVVHWPLAHADRCLPWLQELLR